MNSLARKETIMTNKSTHAPFNSLEEIAVRKAQLRKQITWQKNVINKDFEAYQEDVDTLKRIWGRIVSLRNLRQKTNVEGVTSKLSRLSSLSSKPGLITAISIGAKVIGWIWKRKRKK